MEILLVPARLRHGGRHRVGRRKSEIAENGYIFILRACDGLRMCQSALGALRTEAIRVIGAYLLLNVLVIAIGSELAESTRVERAFRDHVHMSELAFIVLAVRVESAKRNQLFDPLVQELALVALPAFILQPVEAHLAHLSRRSCSRHRAHPWLHDVVRRSLGFLDRRGLLGKSRGKIHQTELLAPTLLLSAIHKELRHFF